MLVNPRINCAYTIRPRSNWTLAAFFLSIYDRCSLKCNVCVVFEFLCMTQLNHMGKVIEILNVINVV